MISIQDLRKKYLGAPQVSDEDLEIVRVVREYVEGEIMPRRQDLDGGWHRDEELARSTFEKVHQGLVDIDVQRAMWPKDFGGLGVSGAVFDLITESSTCRQMLKDCHLANPIKRWECVIQTQMPRFFMTM